MRLLTVGTAGAKSPNLVEAGGRRLTCRCSRRAARLVSSSVAARSNSRSSSAARG
jgi:hypothetical protein